MVLAAESVFFGSDGVDAAVYILFRNRQIQQDIERHNQQYAPIKLHFYNKAHDQQRIVCRDSTEKSQTDS